MKSQNVAWFCIRSQPKHEHIAAACLKRISDVEVFLPQIRFKRMARQKPSWVTEALFPGYFFTRFDLQSKLRQVQYSSGVRGVVHFGKHWPLISEKTIDELQKVIGATSVHTIPDEFEPGDSIRIAEGSLRGLNAVISRVMPSRERVAVLMELLGQQTMIELAATSIVKDDNGRFSVLGEISSGSRVSP